MQIESSPDNLDLSKEIDRSDDSVVYLLNNPHPLDLSSPYADDNRTIVQLLDPLSNRIYEEDMRRVLNWYVTRTKQIFEKGNIQTHVDGLGPITYAIENIEQGKIGDKPAFFSPYVPGPQLDKYLTHKLVEKEDMYGLGREEYDKIMNFVNSKGEVGVYRMRNALNTVNMECREISEIVHLDSVNVKFRWDLDNDCPALIVTDIQNMIGGGIV